MIICNNNNMCITGFALSYMRASRMVNMPTSIYDNNIAINILKIIGMSVLIVVLIVPYTIYTMFNRPIRV